MADLTWEETLLVEEFSEKMSGYQRSLLYQESIKLNGKDFLVTLISTQASANDLMIAEIEGFYIKRG